MAGRVALSLVIGGAVASSVGAAINTVESRVREAVPIARVIYVEPDVWVEPGHVAPATDAIVIRAAD